MIPAAILAIVFVWKREQMLLQKKLEQGKTTKKIAVIRCTQIAAMFGIIFITKLSMLDVTLRLVLLTISALVLMGLTFLIKDFILMSLVVLAYIMQLDTLYSGFGKLYFNGLMLFGILIVLTIDSIVIWKYLQKRKANVKEQDKGCPLKLK